VPSQSGCCPALYFAGLSRLCAVPELSVPFHVDALFVPCHVNGILGVCFGGASVILAQTLALQAVLSSLFSRRLDLVLLFFCVFLFVG
jgi:hypothetical protein